MSGRLSQASEKKDFNDEEVAKKIQDLRKKARQDMMDVEALDGVSLAHYLRIKQATSRLLSTDENMAESEEQPVSNAVEKVKEDEMKKMARNILKKWQNFTEGEHEPKEIRPKRRKSVRFKDEVEMKENLTENSQERPKSTADNPKDVQIVFPAIIQPRPATRQKRKKIKENFVGTLLPPITQNDAEKYKELTTKNDVTEVLIHDRLPRLRLRPVSLTTRTPPPSEEDESDGDVTTHNFVINHLQDDLPTEIPINSSQELNPQTNPNSPTLSRQPTPFPGDGSTEVPTLTREPTIFWKLKKKLSESPRTKAGRQKAKDGRAKKALLKRIESYEVTEEGELANSNEGLSENSSD